jgi:AbrB family looped-hinge helix DNA binding protein
MIQLKLGTKGEIIIPKKIREAIGLTKENKVILEIKGKTLILHAPEVDIVKKWEERAKRVNLDPKKLIYGDKLYEEVFG